MDLFSIATLLSILDIILVSYLVYRVLQIIRGTRAIQMLFGLSLIIILYFIASSLQLFTLEWLLGNFLSSIILVVIVLFQEEIRRGLTKFGIKPLFFGNSKKFSIEIVDQLAITMDMLSKSKTGALIVIQREIGLEEFLEEAVKIDALFSKKLVNAIFHKTSALHDGAIIIDQNRIRAAGCLLPLSFNPDLDPNLGTRHRAALGISERTDAVVLIVSEENGSISIVEDGQMQRNLSLAKTKKLLTEKLEVKSQEVTANA